MPTAYRNIATVEQVYAGDGRTHMSEMERKNTMLGDFNTLTQVPHLYIGYKEKNIQTQWAEVRSRVEKEQYEQTWH